jgi:hypothetical protein
MKAFRKDMFCVVEDQTRTSDCRQVKKFQGLDSMMHDDCCRRRRSEVAWFGRNQQGSFCRGSDDDDFPPSSTAPSCTSVPNTMSTMSALQLSRQLTLRAMRNQQTSLLARSLVASRPASSSSKPVPKGRLLEKPTRFNPPSHPARLPRRNRQPAFSVPLSAKEKEQQKTKQYPHMMPPQGTFFHWFLTNRTIHVWITMVCISLLFPCLRPSPLTVASYSQSSYP